MGLLAHLLIEQHEVFLDAACSREVDESFDSLSACFFGHRASSMQSQYHYKRLRMRLVKLAAADMLEELDRNFSNVFKQNPI